MRIIVEGTTAFLTLEFRDICGDPQPPSSASYRIDCLTTGTEVQPDTSFLVGFDGRYTLRLTPENNAIINDANLAETKRVSVLGIYNVDGDQVPGVYDYIVERIQV